jgi:heat shock protein HslJ
VWLKRIGSRNKDQSRQNYMKKRLLAVLISLAFTLSVQAQDIAGKWKLIRMEIDGKTISLTAPVTLNIGRDNKIGGSGGCNTYGGNSTFEAPDKISFSGLFATEMYCKDSSNIERNYFQALESARTAWLKNGELVIQNSERRSVLRFSGERALKREKLNIFVGPKMVDCVQVAPKKCLRVKFYERAGWRSFYEEIEGFKFEKGFYYLLEAERERVEQPPKDTSLYKYSLVRIVKKSRKSF